MDNLKKYYRFQVATLSVALCCFGTPVYADSNPTYCRSTSSATQVSTKRGETVAWECPTQSDIDSTGNTTYANWSIGGGKTHDYQVSCVDNNGHEFPPVSYHIHCNTDDVDVSFVDIGYSGDNVFTNMTITNWGGNTHFYIQSIKCAMVYDQVLNKKGIPLAPKIGHDNCSSVSDFYVWGGVQP